MNAFGDRPQITPFRRKVRRQKADGRRNAYCFVCRLPFADFLDPKRLSLLKIFEGPDITTYLFHYTITDELASAVLTEGLRFESKTRDDLQPEEVVPWHWHMLNWYWDTHQTLAERT